MIRFIFLVLFFLSCGRVLAACGSECWVDLAGTGSGTANGTSVSNQCAGIADTDCTPVAGSIVHLCNAGTTITPQAVDGTTNTPIEYTASCTGGVDGSLNALGQTHGVNITNRAWLTFTGLDVTAPTQAGYLINCSVGNTSANVRIEDADVFDVVGNGATIGNGFRWFCADVTLWNTSVAGSWSDAYYCDTCNNATIDGDRTNSRGWYAANFATGDANGDGIQIVDGDNAIIRNGTCTHPRNGIKLCVIQSSTSSVGGLVQNNYIYDGVDGGISWVAPGGSIERNEIWNISGGNSGSGAAIGIKLLGTNQRAIGNIVVDVKKCFSSDQNNTTVQYINNVCFGFRDRGLDANTVNAITLTLENNIFVGLDTLTTSNYAVIIGSGVTETIDYNDYFNLGSAQWRDTSTSYATLALWQASGKDANSLNVTPNFVGGTSPTTAEGFKLKSISSLVRSGTSLNLGNIQDYSNQAFFLDKPSIGAYEIKETLTRTNR